MDSRKEPATSLADFLLLVQDHVLPVPIIPQGKLPKGMSEEAPLWPKKKCPNIYIFSTKILASLESLCLICLSMQCASPPLHVLTSQTTHQHIRCSQIPRENRDFIGTPM